MVRLPNLFMGVSQAMVMPRQGQETDGCSGLIVSPVMPPSPLPCQALLQNATPYAVEHGNSFA
jgi:hypothetical protein